MGETAASRSIARPVEVTAATAEHLRGAADVLLLANLEDPTAQALIPPGSLRREERLHLMFQAEVHQAGLDRIDLALDATTRQVLGVAVWSGPPRPRGAGPTSADAARWAMASVAALGHTGALTGRRVTRALTKVQPPEPHWFLLDLAVDPVAQRAGIGTSLLRHRLAQIDAEGKRAFLCASTPDSARLYARHGFVAGAPLPHQVGGATPMVRRPVITA